MYHTGVNHHLTGVFWRNNNPNDVLYVTLHGLVEEPSGAHIVFIGERNML